MSSDGTNCFVCSLFVPFRLMERTKYVDKMFCVCGSIPCKSEVLPSVRIRNSAGTSWKTMQPVVSQSFDNGFAPHSMNLQKMLRSVYASDVARARSLLARPQTKKTINFVKAIFFLTF